LFTGDANPIKNFPWFNQGKFFCKRQYTSISYTTGVRNRIAAGQARITCWTIFNAFSKTDVDFYPVALQERIDQTIDAICQPINNGVYRSGFAASQSAYEEAVTKLFKALDYWETVLSQQRYLCGNSITEADWCFFTTLFRFK